MSLQIFGAGGHSRVIQAIALGNGIDFQVFDDHPPNENVLPTSHCDPQGMGIVAIGDNRSRQKFVTRFPEMRWCNVIHRQSIIDPTAKLGQGVMVCAGAVIQCHVVIGDHVIVNSNSTLEHDCRLDSFCHLAPGATICGTVHVMEGSLIGAGSTVLPNRKIGSWSVLGAGGVAIADLQAESNNVGVPAKPRTSQGGVTEHPHVSNQDIDHHRHHHHHHHQLPLNPMLMSTFSSVLREEIFEPLEALLGDHETDVFRFLRERVAERMAGNGSGSHDFAHVQRVIMNTYHLTMAERRLGSASPFSQADLFVGVLCALFHDWADDKAQAPEFHGRPLDALLSDARQLMGQCFLVPELIHKVCRVCEGLGFRKRTAAQPPAVRPTQLAEFPEFFIVEDADALDALGPVGEARCAMVCGERGLPFYSPSTPLISSHLIDPLAIKSTEDRSFIDHHQCKLLRLAGMMHTASARKRAFHLDAAMRQFLFHLEDQLVGGWTH